MYKIIFLSFLFLSVAFGLDLKDPKTYQTFESQIEILLDPQEQFTISNIPLDKFQNTKNRALGYQKGAVWSKLKVTNLPFGEWVFINPKININTLEVSIFEDNRLVKNYKLGNYNGTTNNAIASKFINFKLQVDPNKTYTIISKIKSKSPIDTTWIASQETLFIAFNLYDILFWGVFLGFILSLVIYNISTFTSLKDFTYIAYAVHGITALLFQLATNGIFYQFGLYDNLTLFNSISWFLAQLSLLSILYFGMFFLATKQTMPILHKIVLVSFWIVVFMMLLFLYSFFNPEIINFVRVITKPLSLFILLFVFFLGVVGVRKKIQGARYYLIGHGFFLLAIIYQQFGGIINNETSFLSIYIVAIGVLFDTLFLSLALGQKLTNLKYEKEKNERLLISQSGFSAIGRTIGNLSHQWKIPIARLGSLIMQMEAIVWQSQDKLKYDLEEILVNIRASLQFMKASIDEFNSFYLHSSQKIEFNLATEMNHILNLLSAKIMYTNAIIEKNLDPNITIFGHKTAFANSCLIIIDNALDILKQRKINNGIVTIDLTLEENEILLTIKDTGGGIEIQPIEKIFEVFVSDKEEGHGMGLAMVKVLVNERLGGKIEVINTTDGACFMIKL